MIYLRDRWPALAIVLLAASAFGVLGMVFAAAVFGVGFAEGRIYRGRREDGP